MSSRPGSATAPPAKGKPVTLSSLAGKKALGEPIAMVTAYDYPSAQVAEEAGVEPEYLELRSAIDLSEVEHVNGSTLLAVAARVGAARLIDNAILAGRAPAARQGSEEATE